MMRMFCGFAIEDEDGSVCCDFKRDGNSQDPIVNAVTPMAARRHFGRWFHLVQCQPMAASSTSMGIQVKTIEFSQWGNQSQR